ncbi:glycoside hydrolase family protein [Cylindrospermum sp. FACHB-282]|uniref:glycoside hydrolase family protein n=1 Tax=Cylindrospermum sp. FACHB-282 TaxID=2692794 RepID=UPI001682303C|nr:peptidoglycan-binding protein [Cylindrospermum sp. FACHB-282]MBD2386897.1 peptidoglycan-binding protein [Cylindrospermum sp. FACHB-282]
MNISQNCLELIKKWEGLFLNAYLDPVNIPTIGYGTIQYPNGKKVRLGDQITEQQAKAYLKDECDQKAEEVSKLVSGISLNQNQFDALVSFCYNLGTGALAESTLLKKLKANDFVGAASEFERWNKAIVNGEKVVFAGLTNRRKDERTLFEKKDGEAIPLNAPISPQDQVTWLEGYRDNDQNVIVAWNGSDGVNKLVEILTLSTLEKSDLISVLEQYKNARNFVFAPATKVIPSGERVLVTARKPTILKVSNPPTLNTPLLVRGVEGDDVKKLQNRLNDLGFDAGEADGIFGKKTEEAVGEFQKKQSITVDGKVGSNTWSKLWGIDAPTVSVPTSTASSTPGKNYLRLTKTQRKDTYGCFILKLEYFKNGQLQGSIDVCSGQPHRQLFETGRESVPNAQPLPEGKWYIDNIQWVGEKDKYRGSFGDGLGPVKIPLNYVEPGKTRRSEILIHLDWNRANSPGTIGCIGVYGIGDFQQLVSWLRDTDPRDLFVDWEKGTCPQP